MPHSALHFDQSGKAQVAFDCGEWQKLDFLSIFASNGADVFESTKNLSPPARPPFARLRAGQAAERFPCLSCWSDGLE